MATKRCIPEPAGDSSLAVEEEARQSRLLREGEVVACILTPVGSNYTFLAKLQDEDGREMRAIYKPMKGEIPLWDFESGTLYKRECAAYLFSQMLGWEFVPETVIREGPYGVGSMQRFVEHEPKVTYRELRHSHRNDLKRIACFDIIANNADRKAVHCIKGLDGRVWGIDHGLTFNAAFTLRTVIWDFWGEELEAEMVEAMEGILEQISTPRGLAKELVELLQPEEVEALTQRTGWLAEMGAFPEMRRF